MFRAEPAVPGRRPLAWLVLLALLAGCSGPPSHYTRLWVAHRTGLPAIGTSTEDGVLLLAVPEWKVGDLFEIHFPVGNSLVRDYGRVERINDTLAVVRPLTARLAEGRIAASLPAPGETLYVSLRDGQDEPVMQAARLLRDGAVGDWLLLPGHDAQATADIAVQAAGTGVYVRRSGRWEIVGLLAGLLATDESASDRPVALGFVGLGELARILPGRVDYFDRDVRPLRPDFEFGVPLQPQDIDLPALLGEDQPAATPSPGPPAGAGGPPRGR